MNLCKRLSQILAAINILLILIATLGALHAVSIFKASFDESTVAPSLIVQLVFNTPKFIFVGFSIVLMAIVLWKEKIKSNTIALLLNFIILIGILAFIYFLFIGVDSHQQALIIFKTNI